MKNLPATPPFHENITLLAVNLDRDDRLSLERILDRRRWTIQGASSLRDATTLLRRQPSLILCEQDLPDGSWRDLVRVTADSDGAPPIVVVSRDADERLWAEVLNVGGYDLLVKPFDTSEVRRVTSMALRHSYHRQNQYTVAFAS